MWYQRRSDTRAGTDEERSSVVSDTPAKGVHKSM